jgi:hypothetical protein
MEFITKNWVAIVAMLIAILGCYLPVSGAINSIGGASCNGGDCTDYSAVNTTAGYYINDVATVTSSLATVGTLTQGGGVFATTSIGSGTLTAANIASANLIEQTNTGVVTITLPASTTLTSFIPTAAQTRTIYLANLGSATVTLAGGTGTLLRVASSTLVTPGVVSGSVGRLDFIRKSNTDVLVLFSPAGGTATTTLVQPAYQNGNSSGLNSATLLVQYTGSSTLSVLNIAFEYASASSGVNCQINPNACDWYKDTLFGAGSPISTSTSANPIGLNTPNSYTLTFSSSTLAGAAGISSRTTRILNVQTPAQYVRAVITMPVGSFPGALWAEWLPVKQTP